MNIKSILVFCILSLISLPAFAGSYCSDVKKHHTANKTTTADTAETYYDMTHIKFNLNFSNVTVAVSGDVTTTAKVTSPTLDKYVFELYSGYTIDSAKFNGVLETVTTVGNVRTITLATPLNAGDVFSAQIFYEGNPPAGGGFFNGVTHAVTTHGSNMVYTVSDPYAAQDWWPSKQTIDDKIDSVDMWVTVPDSVKVGSNGLLLNVVPTAPGFVQYQWQTRYPIDYYLISVAVAPYVIDSSYLHFPTGDSMLIQNFFMDTASFYPAYKANFDSIGLIINYFSSLFGKYPFWKEKYGVCYTSLPGGMEHQTMTTLGLPNTYNVIAHELCHQWFGDHVTYSKWGHVWLSEGFATYSEQLFISHFWDSAAAVSYRQAEYTNVMSSVAGTVYVTDTSGPNTLFNTRLVYNKGAAVVHMLRFLAPTDSLFFQVLKTYQQQYAFGLASTEDLRAIAENVYGMNLDTFFHQWVYGQGYPKYHVYWDQNGSTVQIQLVQTAAYPTSIPLFSTPLELRLHSATGDTIVRVYNDSATQNYTFNWSQVIDTVVLNPRVSILCKSTGATHSLNIGSLVTPNVKIYPNPTKNNWQIEQLPAGVDMTLFDATGHEVWKGKTSKSTTTVPARNLAPGNYLLKLANSNNDTGSIRLVRW